MIKTILITGATDGIGLETAKMLAKLGHHIILHGRNPDKLKASKDIVSKHANNAKIDSVIADLSHLDDVKSCADQIKANYETLDILINNAGILKTPNTITSDGFDIRIMVNAIAPYLLTQELLPIIPKDGRIINVASAAQAPVDHDALTGNKTDLQDMNAYAQSKLAIIMWSYSMAHRIEQTIIPVNPGSLLASKMVKEGFGIPGSDLSKGAEILTNLSLEDIATDKFGQYYDNDNRCFADPHPDALDIDKCQKIEDSIKRILNR